MYNKYTTIQKFRISKIFFMFLKETYAHCMHFMKKKKSKKLNF